MARHQLLIPRSVRVEPVSAEAFAPFGHVVAARGRSNAVNAGSAQRFDALAPIELVNRGAQAALSIFRAHPVSLPFGLRLLERHRLGSQAFVPMAAQRFVAVVASDSGGKPALDGLRAFLCDGTQGISYSPMVWHHPLIALDAGDFLVVDRVGNSEDCEEMPLENCRVVEA